jgi:hypothetical protein
MPESQTNSIPYGLKMPWQDTSSSTPSNALPYGLTAPWEDNSAKATASTSAKATASAQPAQPQHTAGYNKALTQAQQNPNSVATGLVNAFNPTTAFSDNRPSIGAFNSTLHGFLYNTLPVLQGTSNAIGTVLQNIVSKTGAVKGTGYSPGEAYQAGRDISQKALDQYQQAHPILGPATNLAGALSNPVTDLIPGLSEAKAVATGNKVVKAAIPIVKAGVKSGVVGTALGIGEGVSRGETAPQVAENALAYGAPAALAGVAGRTVAPLVGKGVSAINSRVSVPALQTATKIGGAALIGATGGAALGLPGAILSGRPDAIINNAEWGALIGAGMGAKGINKAAKEPAPVMPNDNASAVEHIVNTVGDGDYGKTASILEASPEKTVAQAIEPTQRTNLMQTSGAQHESNLTDLQGAVAQHQAPETVKGRLSSNLETTAGSNPKDISDFVSAAPTEEANNLALKAANEKTAAEAKVASEKADAEAKATPEALVNNGTLGISKALDIDPRTAESDWEGIAKNNRETVSKPLWDKVETDTSVNTKEHNDLMANEPVVRQAFGDAKRVLGPEAETEIPNPKFDPNAPKPVTPQTLSAADIREVSKDRVSFDEKGNAVINNNVPTVQHGNEQAIADYLNNKRGSNSPSEPETLTVPTQKAWIQIERNLRQMVPRNTFGTVDYSNPRTVEIQQTHEAVNNANKEHFKGLSEAKAASGEDKSSLSANENAYKFNPKSLNGESAEKFIDRYNKQGETQQKATQHGYLERFFQKFRENPVSTAKEYLNSDQHQKVMSAMFGKNAEYMNAQLQATLEAVDRPKQIVPVKDVKYQTPIGDTINNAQKLIKSEKISDFNHAYDNDTEHQHLYKDAYTDHINNLINGVESNGNVEPSHLKDLEHLVTSNFHKEVQDKLYGPEKAEQLRTAIKKEVKSASVGKEISGFKPNVAEPRKFFNMVPSTLFGMAGAKHTPSGALEGALAGAKIAKGEETIHEVAHAINQSKMSPGTARAIGNHLASSPQEFAKEVRANEAKKRNMPMSKSDIGKRIGNKAALGIGLLAGKRISNALDGVDTNQ